MGSNGLRRGKVGSSSINKKLPTTGTPVCSAIATGTLTMDTKPTADNTLTIGSTVYTFVATPAAAGDVAIGAAVANSQANLVTAINDGDDFNSAHPDVTAADFSGDDMVITAKAHGTAANDIDTTETFTAGTNVFAAAKLSGGVEGTPGTPGDQKVDSTYLYICVANIEAGGNWRRISLGSAY